MDENVRKTIRRYQDLALELKDLYQLDSVRVIPFVISINGLVPEDTVAAVRELGEGIKIVEEAQKAVILDTARIVRKFFHIQ